jgi:hypothetical protein
MTEAEWNTCTDPQKMLEFLRGKVSDRKLRLFAVACCRRIWHLLTDERSRSLVEKVEQYADGLLTIFQVSATWDTHEQAYSSYDFKAPWYAAMASSGDAEQTARDAADATGCEVWWNSISDDDPIISLVHSSGGHAEQKTQCRLLRDIFGSPFSPVILDRTWLAWNDGTVVKLAQAIYDGRRFDDMPILADALMDAGCHDEEILAHCRSGGGHVRGCWVLDLVVGKK